MGTGDTWDCWADGDCQKGLAAIPSLGALENVDALRRLQAETQKELDALMPSILAKAFAGEL